MEKRKEPDEVAMKMDTVFNTDGRDVTDDCPAFNEYSEGNTENPTKGHQS